jgi:hypothetical protein
MRASLLGVVVLLAAEAWPASASGQSVSNEAALVAGDLLGFSAPAAPLRMPTAEEVFAHERSMRRWPRSSRR